MKRLVIGLAFAAAATATFAQSGSAECQLGGNSPAYCNPAPAQPYPYGTRSPYRWGEAVPYGYTVPWGLAQAVPPPAYGYGYGYGHATPHRRTRHDRDGDGIRNRDDRYPGDPRYR